LVDAGKVIVADSMNCGAVGMSHSAVGAPKAMTPQIKLVDDYGKWFASAFGDSKKPPDGISNYLTDTTVLHEALSLPWGGTYVGYAGWVALRDKGMASLGWTPDMSAPQYWQRDNVVLREVVLTIKPTKPSNIAPESLNIDIIEKYTIENRRISRVEVFYDDTAILLQRLALGT
jgi:hypothetical protein